MTSAAPVAPAEMGELRRANEMVQAAHFTRIHRKLTRAFPLGGGDAPQTTPGTEESTAVGVEMGAVAPVAGSEESLLAVATRARDYTEPKTITLVITDLGAWAPSAVSEELLMLYA